LLGARQEPIQRLISALDDADVSSDGRISLSELKLAIQRCNLDDTALEAIFGTNQVETILGSIDRDADESISFDEILNFLESVGVDVTTQLVGFPARPTTSVLDFALNILEAVNRDLTRANFRALDRLRIVPINTDYVGTTTFDLVAEDFAFLVETGRRHVDGFLDEYRAREWVNQKSR
jgi:hypothetical protein